MALAVLIGACSVVGTDPYADRAAIDGALYDATDIVSTQPAEQALLLPIDEGTLGRAMEFAPSTPWVVDISPHAGGDPGRQPNAIAADTPIIDPTPNESEHNGQKATLVDNTVLGADESMLIPSPAPDPRQVLPPILSAEDANRYRHIFALQIKGRWRDADKEIARLGDRSLMGHVQAQRYLHPTRYRSRYHELASWLKSYADHPQSGRIYRLALRRKPGSARSPRRPRVGQGGDYEEYPWEREVTYVSPRKRSRNVRREARRLIRKVRIFSRSGRLTLARRTLAHRHTRRTLDAVEMDIARAYIGRGYFYRSNAAKAYEYAGPAATRSGRYMPFAQWTAGLAAYALGRYTEAAVHFEAMAEPNRGSGWSIAAAGFWAARANMIAGRPDRVSAWLQEAAAHPRTFYGLLAARLLGDGNTIDWNVPRLSMTHVDAIVDHRGGKRGLALVQIGQIERAEREFRSLTVVDDPDLGRALLALADAIRMPALSLKTAAMLAEDDGGPKHGALYPIPSWRPEGGFIVDRALIYAFMRQESRFNTRAKSRVGARGLMQLMPATASFVARRRFRGSRRSQLYDPELNIALGQKYLQHLIEHKVVQGSILLLAAAYNGGPGNLAKWRRRAARGRFLDPLLFIESLPSHETRVFIERVIANLWLYRHRLGQPSPSLDALAAGETPIYKSLDDKSGSVASNERD